MRREIDKVDNMNEIDGCGRSLGVVKKSIIL